MGKRWNKSEIVELKKYVLQNETAKEISKKLKRTESSIWGKTFKLNIKISRGRKVNHNELIGKRFGRLIVIGYSHKIKEKNRTASHRYFYKTKCDCGKEKIAAKANLVHGNVKSCGCLKKVAPGIAVLRRKMALYKRNAEIKNRKFELNEDAFLKLCQQDCFYCGSKPIKVRYNQSHNGDLYANGIDRLNNNLGYSIKNCVPCCKKCNTMKREVSFNEYKEKINTIFNRINHSIVYLDRQL